MQHKFKIFKTWNKWCLKNKKKKKKMNHEEEEVKVPKPESQRDYTPEPLPKK